MKSKYCITGGSGFIGSNVAEALVEKEYEVTILDNFSTGNRENLKSFENKITVIEGDVRDPFAVIRAVANADYVIHLAALPSVIRSIKNPVYSNWTNTTGTFNVFEACRKVSVKKVIYISSASVYGNNPIPMIETMTPKPLNLYAITKVIGEYYADIYYKIYGLNTVSLRPFNVFGKRQNPDSEYSAAIPKFIRAIMNNEPITVYGDGRQTRNFTYIDNLIKIILGICDSNIGGGEIINATTDGNYSVNYLIQALGKIFNKKVEVGFGELRATEIKHSKADTTKLKEILPDLEYVEFEEGLKRTVEWYAKQ